MTLNNKEHTNNMPKKTAVPTLADALAANATIATYLAAQEGEAEEEADAEEDEEERARLTALGIRALRAEAKEAGFDPADIKGASKEDLIEALLDQDDEDDDADDSDEDEDADDDDTEEGEDDDDDSEDEDDADDDDTDDNYSEADLDAMSLKEVKAVLKESGWTVADMKGKDQETLVAEYGEHVGFAEGDEDDSEDDTDEDDDEDALDEDALNEMSLSDLKKVAAEYEVTIPAKIAKNKAKIVALILEEAGEEDDDEPDL